MQSFEKRHFIRARADFEVTVELLDRAAGYYQFRVSDISIDGIHLHSEAELPLDAKLVLTFPAEWGGICAVVKVVRRIGSDYGCQFLELPLSARKMLDTAIYRYWRQNLHNSFSR